MISVCMATYNGGQYLKAQIDSILNQLSVNDELVISDDHSTDNTCAIIKQYNDSRVKLVLNELTKGVTHNFDAGGNLAASNIRNLECPSYEVYLIDYGCGKFNKKVHIME